MALSTGTRLGAYEITGTVGAGGMGEIYRATDRKLGREVAIKTLPAAFAADRDRLARFEREARLLAALNHAHIASIYGLDDHEGTLYLAMELIEGETLEEKLKSGALQVEDALQLARQIAEALEAAHEKGVIHRDLKPANVMVTRDGVVKVLDFGLAKAFSGNPSAASPQHSPTLSAAMTQAGLVLGTAGYMSPEQASGQATDQRTDVWAFGVVLYEMLTGIPVFAGESVPHILADVLKSEPDWSRLPRQLHPRLRFLLERCLEKKARNRLHSMADARIEIEAVLRDPQGLVASAAAEAAGWSRSPRARWLTAALVAGALLVSGLATGFAVWYLKPPSQVPVVRFTEEFVEDTRPEIVRYPLIDISRDGTRIAYAAGSASREVLLYVRNVDDPVARPVDGLPPAILLRHQPRFSPDGQWLAYWQVPASIWRVPLSGGAPQPVVSGLQIQPGGIDWDESGMLLFCLEEVSKDGQVIGPRGIYEVPAAGGEPSIVVAARDGEVLASPRRLPGSDAVLFTAARGTSTADWDAGEITVYSPSSGERTVVWPGGRDARYVHTGHLVYAQGGALFAVAFDLARLQVTGNPVPVIEEGIVDASGESSFGSAQYAVSETGSLVRLAASDSVVASDAPKRTLLWVTRDGTEQPLSVDPDDYRWARIAPDGRRVALVIGSVTTDLDFGIWILDLETGNTSRLASPADWPVWSLDGERIYFRGVRNENFASGVDAVSAEGGAAELIAESPPDFPYAAPWSILPDGETLAVYYSMTANTDFHLATLGVRPGSGFQALLRDASSPSFSPNGSWMAYNEGVGSARVVNVVPYPDITRRLFRVAQGRQPVFSRDGRELFYIADDALWSVPIQYEPTFRIGTPEVVFRGNYRWGSEGRAWDPHPDGERFLMIAEPDTAAGESPAPSDRHRLHVVVNWAEDLSRRVPVR